MPNDDLINLLPEELRSEEQDELARPSVAADAVWRGPTPAAPIVPPLDLDIEDAVPTPPPVQKAEQVSKPIIEQSTKNELPSNNSQFKGKEDSFKTANNKAAALAKTKITEKKLAWWQKMFAGKPDKNKTAEFNANGDPSFSQYDVNLIPQAVTLLPMKVLQLRLLLAAVIGIFLVSAIHFVLLMTANSYSGQVVQLQEMVRANQEKLKEYKNLQNEIKDLKNQILSINELTSKHIYWTEFLKNLEDLTPDFVYYTSMSAELSGNVSLTVMVPDYLALAKLVRYWQNNKLISESSFTGASAGESGVSFSTNLKLSPIVFYKK